MSYKMRLQWFSKETSESAGKEFSPILDDGVYFLDRLGLSSEHQIYDGNYDVKEGWLSTIQQYFQHNIDLRKYDYQLAFRYL